jgi:hypothetical protein
MSGQDNEDNSNSESNAVNRRHMLLGGTTLAAASALGTAASVQKAVAQAQQAAPSPLSLLHAVPSAPRCDAVKCPSQLDDRFFRDRFWWLGCLPQCHQTLQPS